MSRQQTKRAIRPKQSPSRRPSHIAPRRKALVYHDGDAFSLAYDLRHQGFDVMEQPLLAAFGASRSGHFAVVAAGPDRVRPQRLCTLLRELCGHGVPTLAIGAALPAVVRLFGGRVVPGVDATDRLADIDLEGDSVLSGVRAPLRLALPAGLAVHRTAVSQELRVVAAARNGEVIGVSHVFRPVHAIHAAIFDDAQARSQVVANVVRSMR